MQKNVHFSNIWLFQVFTHTILKFFGRISTEFFKYIRNLSFTHEKPCSKGM